jgi:hypothetical protein
MKDATTPTLRLADNNRIEFQRVDMSKHNGIVGWTTKAPVVALAKKLGLPQTMICRGYNRFFLFWFIGQQQGETFRVWNEHGDWFDYPFDYSGTLSRSL